MWDGECAGAEAGASVADIHMHIIRIRIWFIHTHALVSITIAHPNARLYECAWWVALGVCMCDYEHSRVCDCSVVLCASSSSTVLLFVS